jgi:hypothetical protein
VDDCRGKKFGIQVPYCAEFWQHPSDPLAAAGIRKNNPYPAIWRLRVTQKAVWLIAVDWRETRYAFGEVKKMNGNLVVVPIRDELQSLNHLLSERLGFETARSTSTV